MKGGRQSWSSMTGRCGSWIEVKTPARSQAVGRLMLVEFQIADDLVRASYFPCPTFVSRCAPAAPRLDGVRPLQGGHYGCLQLRMKKRRENII